MSDGAHLQPSGPVFTAPFSAVALTTNPHDLFCVTASTSSRVVVREIRLGQYSEFGDSQSELLSLTIMTGSTAAASAGSTITPVNVQSHSGAPTANTAVIAASTTLGSTTSATVRYADAWNVAAGYLYTPPPPERIVLNPGQIMLFRMSAPNDAMTMNGTITLQEIGL